MKQKPPAFQFYVKQWLGDDKILLMDFDAKGMHADLMCIAWQQDEPGTLPNEEAILRRWLKNPSDETWARVWPQIKAAWQISPKKPFKLYSRALLRESRKQRQFSRKQKENASKRWSPRRRKSDAMADAMAMPSHNSGNARAGNALLSSHCGVKKEKERSADARPLGGPAPLERPNGHGALGERPGPMAAVIEGDDPPEYGRTDFLAIGQRNPKMPSDEFGWDCLERSMCRDHRVMSEWRAKGYPQNKLEWEATLRARQHPAEVPSGDMDDVF